MLEDQNQFKNDFKNFLFNISSHKAASLFDNLIKRYGAQITISHIASTFWTKPAIATSAVCESKSLKVTRNKIKTIAIYFYSFGTGGGERVTHELITMWKAQGFKVILITDIPPQPNDYSLPKDVKRYVIPDLRTISSDKYAFRGEALHNILLNEKVDILIFAHWFSHTLPWDMITTKLLGIPFLIYIQTSFTQFFLERVYPGGAQGLIGTYKLADGIISLSKMDCMFWSHFNNNVFETINPLTLPVTKSSAPLKGHTIIWPARLHPDKCPERVIPIMQNVVKSIPDATLLMIGPCSDEFKHSFTLLIKKKNLDKHILIIPPQNFKDMINWYMQSDAYLLTSRREGWSLALAEALAVGLPCVIYDLPYLTLVDDNKAVLTAPQDDVEKISQLLIKVLLDKTLAHYMSKIGRNKITRLENYNFPMFWNNCFTSTLTPHSHTISNENALEQTLWNSLLNATNTHMEQEALREKNYQEALQQQQQALLNLKKDKLQAETSLANLRNDQQAILGSVSFTLGRVLTAVPRAIKSKLNTFKSNL
jgi:glycosyltransferase involved in cell wall biosynthesis